MRLLIHSTALMAVAALAKADDKGHAAAPAAGEQAAPAAAETAPEAQLFDAAAGAPAATDDGQASASAPADAAPEGSDDVEALKARIVDLEAERTEITAAAETAIAELQARLAGAVGERDAALADLKKARRDLAWAERSALIGSAPATADAGGEPADPAATLAEDYVVMQTSRVIGVDGAAIARGRVAIGQPDTLAGLIEDGRARPATQAEAAAAATLAVID